MKFLLALLLLSIACSAQSTRFAQEHNRGLSQNPPGVKLTIELMNGRSAYHLSDVIKFKLTFTSQKSRVYTIDTAAGGNAAASSADFVIEGPGLSEPVHSYLRDPHGFVCCENKRRYLGPSPVSISYQNFSLQRIESSMNGMLLPPLGAVQLKAGEYVVFAQTRNVIRGWPKNLRDTNHALSDLVVTSTNIVHFTIVPDTR